MNESEYLIDDPGDYIAGLVCAAALEVMDEMFLEDDANQSLVNQVMKIHAYLFNKYDWSIY